MYELRKISILTVSCLLFVALLMMPAMAGALTLGGDSIIAIDGDADGGVDVNIMSVAYTTGYTYGYYLNGGTTVYSLGSSSLTNFQGGDIIDFVLNDGTREYTLSGDAADNTYSVEMTFANEVTTGTPQQPADWTSPYYYNVNITWFLPDTLNTNSLALNDTNGNDGVAPIPEPGVLLLLGSGLVGLGGLGFVRRRFNV